MAHASCLMGAKLGQCKEGKLKATLKEMSLKGMRQEGQSWPGEDWFVEGAERRVRLCWPFGSCADKKCPRSPLGLLYYTRAEPVGRHYPAGQG